MVRTLFRLFGYVCIGTVLTQMILMMYFMFTGSLNRETGTQIVALLNGIDITGKRLQQILRAGEDREQPDFEEILEARRREGMNMDLRIRSTQEASNELSTQWANIVEEKKYLDARVASFNQELDRIEADARQEGLREVQTTIQAMEPDQAKDQLLRMFNDERIDDVVGIVQAMPPDKRSEILAEFESPQEKDAVYEILRRIGDGLPTTKLIEDARAR